MPTMGCSGKGKGKGRGGHPITCPPFCPTDVVFFIYLYQRWIYRVDPTRVNEFGLSGEQQQQQQQQRLPAPPALPPTPPQDKKKD